MLARIHYLGGSLVFIQPVNPMDPGFGVGVGGGHPDQSLPGMPAHPSHGLPGSGAHPGHDLPHLPGVPDNTLPTTPPPHIQPGATLVLVRDPMGVWHYAAIPQGQPVPTPLPVPPPTAAPKT